MQCILYKIYFWEVFHMYYKFAFYMHSYVDKILFL
jgi:hypothetical protein